MILDKGGGADMCFLSVCSCGWCIVGQQGKDDDHDQGSEHKRAARHMVIVILRLPP